jgi:ABC-2 type transport system ATP-binding protein
LSRRKLVSTGFHLKKQSEKLKQLLKDWACGKKRNEQARTLSGGFKRRLMIAKALIHEPKLLILDEPTAGVDIELRREMWEFLKEINANGTTIILTTHYLEEAEQLCKNIAIIDHGELVENTSMKDLLSRLRCSRVCFRYKSSLWMLRHPSSNFEINLARCNNIKCCNKKRPIYQ